MHTKGLPRQHFSLSEEARNTERHHSWNSDLKLRHSRIAFVSAGTSKAEDLTQVLQEKPSENSDYLQEANNKDVTKQSDLDAEVPISNMTLNEADKEDFRINNSRPTVGVGSVEKGEGDDDDGGERGKQEVFFADVRGSDHPESTGLTPPKVRRSPSPAFSTSSEEVILFTGRNTFHNRTKKADNSTESSKNTQNGVSQGFIHPARNSHNSLTTVLDPPFVCVARQGLPLTMLPHHETPKVASSKEVRRHRTKRSRKSAEEAEAMNDYIANARNGGGFEGFGESIDLNRRDLGDSSGDLWVDDEEISAAGSQDGFVVQRVEEWDSADIHDFDELSTSSEEVGMIERVLSKRERTSGTQYLVVGGGLTIDDARWLPVRSLGTSNAKDKIRRYEEEQEELQRVFGTDDDTDDSLASDQQLALDFQEEMDDLEDERDLEERRKERMTDEQIARLLSKQEELGLGSSNLMLFNGYETAGNELEEAQLDGSFGSHVTLQPQNRSKGKKRNQPSFPSASEFADVLDHDPYNGFDVMDQERPSLRKRPKGRRGIELSDSELEQTITKAWENDRTKKKNRKQEREELRARGLLGKKGKIDLKAKYGEGMSIDQVKAEIRVFLLSPTERYAILASSMALTNFASLPLPPMAKKERKIVHEIANVFKLKSKSIGGGKSRYPILYRTARTVHYDEGALGMIDATLSSDGFLPRMDKSRKRGPPAGRDRGGFASAGVSYRDGEIVGAAAPELGQENKGRAMLEKMGWSTGKTLGALNNTRGIAQPVAQIVKTGKAGLG